MPRGSPKGQALRSSAGTGRHAVQQDDLPSLHTLAAGIDRDRDEVIAGLTLPGNPGSIEGNVNRIKMFKRQMFGRRAPLAPGAGLLA